MGCQSAYCFLQLYALVVFYFPSGEFNIFHGSNQVTDYCIDIVFAGCIMHGRMASSGNTIACQ